MIRTRIGFALAAAAAMLIFSPEARKGVRKWLVKGTEFALDLTDQVKGASAAIGLNSAAQDQAKKRQE